MNLVPGEVNPRERELSAHINEIDPFSSVDKERVKQILKDEDELEVYDYEKDNVADLNY